MQTTKNTVVTAIASIRRSLSVPISISLVDGKALIDGDTETEGEKEIEGLIDGKSDTVGM